MFNKKWFHIIVPLLIVSVLTGACGGTTPQPAGDKGGEAVVQEKTQNTPTELKIALMNQSTLEEPWNTAMIQSLERVIAEKPHGLNISYKFAESIASPDGERVMREFANTGEYGILWHHGVYPDSADALRQGFPELLIAASGSGFEPRGGNMYWVQMYVHEAAYLLGMIAGMTTKADTIGVVAGFPFDNVNLPLNGYIAGAQSVNPKVKVKMTYIESWFDPPKAKESALAQIAAGADIIFAERFGPFEAAQEKGALAFGHYVDQNSLAPEVVVSSTLARWDPVIHHLIDAWWEHQVNGTPYDAPMKEIVYSMAEGGCDIAPYHNFDSELPQEVKDAVSKARQDIINGKLKVPFNPAPVESD
ncbi:MAG: BMP family ABC transporter substrate-binding protein [Chloroflexota bacterium]|nr:MAG: BMP family ABC transporter substrate-binding protein [Chloroflexota bacterium]